MSRAIIRVVVLLMATMIVIAHRGLGQGRRWSSDNAADLRVLRWRRHTDRRHARVDPGRHAFGRVRR